MQVHKQVVGSHNFLLGFGRDWGGHLLVFLSFYNQDVNMDIHWYIHEHKNGCNLLSDILVPISSDCCLIYLSFLCNQGPEVRSGDLPQPITLASGQEFTFTIRRGVGTETCVSVNYDDFVNDVEVGDMLLVDGMQKLLFGYLKLHHSSVIIMRHLYQAKVNFP